MHSKSKALRLHLVHRPGLFTDHPPPSHKRSFGRCCLLFNVPQNSFWKLFWLVHQPRPWFEAIFWWSNDPLVGSDLCPFVRLEGVLRRAENAEQTIKLRCIMEQNLKFRISDIQNKKSSFEKSLLPFAKNNMLIFVCLFVYWSKSFALTPGESIVGVTGMTVWTTPQLM